MIQEHIDQAVRESCPYAKQHCIMATLGACRIIIEWQRDHRAYSASSVQIDDMHEFLSVKGRRGANATALRRLIHV